MTNRLPKDLQKMIITPHILSSASFKKKVKLQNFRNNKVVAVSSRGTANVSEKFIEIFQRNIKISEEDVEKYQWVDFKTFFK